MTIGKQIQKIRSDLGLNQTDFSKEVGITSKALWSYENEKTVPSIKVLEKISNYSGHSTDYIIHGDGSDQDQDTIKDPNLFEAFLYAQKLPKNTREQIIKIINTFN